MPPPVMAELLDEMIAFFVAEFQAVISMIPANPKANPIISIEVQFYQKKMTGSKNLSSKVPPLKWYPTSSALDFALARAPLLFATSALRLGGETHVKPYRKPENEGIGPPKKGPFLKGNVIFQTIYH